jgi:spermidine/putrescine-binding protein
METHEFHDKLREGKLTRRQAPKVMASAGVGTLAATSMPNLAKADGSAIMMFTWGGYDDAAFALEYQEKYRGPPQYSLFGDQAEALSKLGTATCVLNRLSDPVYWRH